MRVNSVIFGTLAFKRYKQTPAGTRKKCSEDGIYFFDQFDRLPTTTSSLTAKINPQSHKGFEGGNGLFKVMQELLNLRAGGTVRE